MFSICMTPLSVSFLVPQLNVFQQQASNNDGPMNLILFSLLPLSPPLMVDHQIFPTPHTSRLCLFVSILLIVVVFFCSFLFPFISSSFIISRFQQQQQAYCHWSHHHVCLFETSAPPYQVQLSLLL